MRTTFAQFLFNAFLYYDTQLLTNEGANFSFIPSTKDIISRPVVHLIQKFNRVVAHESSKIFLHTHFFSSFCSPQPVFKH